VLTHVENKQKACGTQAEEVVSVSVCSCSHCLLDPLSVVGRRPAGGVG